MNDLIDRELLIEQIKEDSYGNEGSYGDMWRFMDTINKMPSVRPELANNSPELDNKNGELISRQAAIDAVKEYFMFSPREGKECAKAIERVPSVPRNGLWIDIKHTFMTKCSVCDWINNDDSSYNFCPNCGADMRGREQG